jgi:DNA-binding transcriptional MerR regulator
MSVATLDTHQVVKSLRAVGFSEEQAEAVTQVVRDSQNLDLTTLATKTDLADVMATMATKTELAEVKAELKTDIAQLRSEVAEVKANMATKTELAELKSNMATKTELAELKANMAETKVEIIKWVVAMAFAQAGLAVALLRFMR